MAALTNEEVAAKFLSLEQRLEYYDKTNRETFMNLEKNLRADSEVLVGRIKVIEDKQDTQSVSMEENATAIDGVKTGYDRKSVSRGAI